MCVYKSVCIFTREKYARVRETESLSGMSEEMRILFYLFLFFLGGKKFSNENKIFAAIKTDAKSFYGTFFLNFN